MEVPQHLGHFQVGTCQVGDLVKRLLQPL